MYYILFQFSRLLVIVAAFAVTESSPFPPLAQRKTFSLEDLIPLKLDFFPERVSAHWLSGTYFELSNTIDTFSRWLDWNN